VYVINSHELNESDILWRFNTDDSIERIDLGVPDSNHYIPAPIGMCMSNNTGMLYVGSSQYALDDPNNSGIYGLDLDHLALVRAITINDMHHITGITEDPTTNELWVSGFNMHDIPVGVPPRHEPPFYEPYLAQIPLSAADGTTVTAYSLENSDPNNDLALPLSIIWTEVCGGADFDGDGIVNLKDFSVLASNWLETNNDVDLNNLDPVDLLDWRIFANYWLKQDCN
ncbi:MAG: hypothetical protein ACYTEN_01940, partial [Planctomycetota bacterium]